MRRDVSFAAPMQRIVITGPDPAIRFGFATYTDDAMRPTFGQGEIGLLRRSVCQASILFVHWSRGRRATTRRARRWRGPSASLHPGADAILEPGRGGAPRRAAPGGDGFPARPSDDRTGSRLELLPGARLSDGALHAIAQARPVIFREGWLERVFSPDAVRASVRDICDPPDGRAGAAA